jgi:hypothetical protein
MPFTEDLKKGKGIEHKICNLIKRKYPSAFVVEGYCEGYDIIVPEIGITVEVKFDEENEKTGNYIIEAESGGKPSGISVSVADWWVIVNKNIIIWITRLALEYLIRNYKLISFFPKDNKREKKAYLIPANELENNPYVEVFDNSTKT